MNRQVKKMVVCFISWKVLEYEDRN